MITLPTFLNGTALCAEAGINPDLWHSGSHNDETLAQAICGRCPLRTACITHALTTPEPHGVWGGLTARQRGRILNPDDPTWLDTDGRVRRACGTFAALMAHMSYGETCTTCQTAQDARVEAQRRAQLKRDHAAGGKASGAAIHRRLGEPVCALCKHAVARQSAARRAARQTPAQHATAA